MNKATMTILVLGGWLAVAGCGETPTNEPKRLEKFVDEQQSAAPILPAKAVEPAEPVQPSEPVAQEAVPESNSEPKPPVEQAAFAETFQSDPAEGAEPATVPPVMLAAKHQDLCRVKVGDTLPEIELPKLLGGTAKLSDLYGKAATVVVFWKGDRQMALDELADLGPDVAQKFGSRGVEVVGVAVNESAADARSNVAQAAASFPQLLDADGKAFSKVGAEKFPWTLVLDANGKIVYFDLEYSLATRRELQQALLATVR
jgi:peroxiredoxin